MLKQLWNDDAGFIVSTELLLIFTIVVLGLVVGLTNVRNAVVTELTEVASAILALNQSYNITGLSGCGGTVGGTSVTDIISSASVTQTANGALSQQSSNISITLCP